MLAAYLGPWCCCLVASHSCGVCSQLQFPVDKPLLGSGVPILLPECAYRLFAYSIHLCNFSLCFPLRSSKNSLAEGVGYCIYT